jgi:hypothetical protein
MAKSSFAGPRFHGLAIRQSKSRGQTNSQRNQLEAAFLVAQVPQAFADRPAFFHLSGRVSLIVKMRTRAWLQGRWPRGGGGTLRSEPVDVLKDKTRRPRWKRRSVHRNPARDYWNSLSQFRNCPDCCELAAVRQERNLLVRISDYKCESDEPATPGENKQGNNNEDSIADQTKDTRLA